MTDTMTTFAETHKSDREYSEFVKMLRYIRRHSEFRRHSEKRSCLFRGVFSHPQNASKTVACGDGWDKKHC